MPDLRYAARVQFLNLLRNEYMVVASETKYTSNRVSVTSSAPSKCCWVRSAASNQSAWKCQKHSLKIRSTHGHHNFWLAGPPFSLAGSEERVQSATVIGWSRVTRVDCLHSPVIASDYFRRLQAAGGAKIVLLYLCIQCKGVQRCGFKT